MAKEELIQLNPEDKKIIEQIEALLGKKLEQVSGIDWNTRRFILNKSGTIVGLGFYRFGIDNIKLKVLVEKIISQTNLTTLDLSSNQLTDISVLKELPNLTTLDLSSNQLTDISVLKELPKLTQLNLSNNRLSDISVLKELPKLTQLNLSFNQLSDISVLKELPNLMKLYLRNNRLSDISVLKELANLTQLYLSSNQLIDISMLKELPNLKLLDLSYNRGRLSDISVLKELSNLVHLNLGNNMNQIRDISFLKELHNLTHLNLSFNNLGDVSVLKQLYNLTHLDLSINNISDITFLKELRNLTYLDLSSNELIDIYPLQNLVNLTELDLSSNELIDIFPLKDLVKHTKLNLVDNKITTVPKEFFERDWLVDIETVWAGDFDLSGNPLETPPVEIIRKGRDAVLTWYSAFEAEGASKLNEVKVLLVGYGGAGKTSLIKRLVKNRFHKNEPKTHGVNIDDWPIKVDGEEIMAHLWDYGGQGIMQATHRVFFTYRCLYILVIDARQESDPEEWLKNIESMGGESPVMVVINKTDEHRFGLNEPELRRKYPNIKGFYHVSCKNGEGIKGFKRQLKTQIGKVEMRGINWPANWAKVRQQIGKMKDTHDYISYSRYERICRGEGVVKEEHQQELVGILHELGIMLHFPDRALENMEVLNPQWATKGIYKVINSKELNKKESKGKLKRNELEHIFNKERLDDQKGRLKQYEKKERDYIVELMNKFELCYDIDDKTILVPDLLDEEEPEEVPQGAYVEFYFEYDFMPANILPRFVVQSRKDIDPELCWRTGAVLKSEKFGSVAVIKQNKNEGRIYIYLTGGNARGYLEVIRDRIDGINKSFAKLPCLEWIPLPDEKQQAVKYDDLIGHEIMGREEKFVGELKKGYSVAELLGRIESRKRTEQSKVTIIDKSMHVYEGGRMEIKKQKITGRDPRIANIEHGDYVEGNQNKTINIEYKNKYGLTTKEFKELIREINQLNKDQQQQLKELSQDLLRAKTKKGKESFSEKIKNHLVNYGIGVAGSLSASGIWAFAEGIAKVFH